MNLNWSIRAVRVGAMTLAAAGCTANAQNLIPNPGFESGNVGFASDYSYSSGGNCCEGQYTIRSNGNSFNGAFVNPPPSSPGSVQMMVVNGSTVPNQRIWYAQISITPGATYDLQLRGCTAVAGGPAILQWQVNGVLVGSSVTLPAVTRQWADLSTRWTAPGDISSVALSVRNLNTATFPNDFYIDDLSMILVPLCPADFNQDGGIDGADVDDFFSAWEAGEAAADVNADGGIDGSDIGVFFAAWEAGGC